MSKIIPDKIADAEKMLERLNLERESWSPPESPITTSIFNKLESILLKIDEYKVLSDVDMNLIIRKAVQIIIGDEIIKYKKQIDFELNKQKTIIELYNKTPPTTIEGFIMLHMTKERYKVIISIIENKKEQHIIKESFHDFPHKFNRYVIEIIDSFKCEENYYY